jgi:hypothetical protein
MKFYIVACTLRYFFVENRNYQAVGLLFYPQQRKTRSDYRRNYEIAARKNAMLLLQLIGICNARTVHPLNNRKRPNKTS